MNRKIAFSLLSIVMAVGMTAGATFAVFTDTAVSSDNTFSTGNADLQIAVDPDGFVGGSAGTYGNDIPAPAINEVGMSPNFTKTYYFWLKNNSSSSINMNLGATFDDVQTTGNSNIVDQFNVALNCGTAAGPATVTTWDGGTYPVGTLAAGAEVQCSMTVSLNDVDNTFQNSSVRFDGMFTGTQS